MYSTTFAKNQLIVKSQNKSGSRVAEKNSGEDFVAVDVRKLLSVTVRRELTLDDAAERPQVVGQATDEGFVDRLDHDDVDTR